MNKYTILRDKQEAETNNFNFMFAFSNEQFKKGMKEKFNLTTDEKDLKKIIDIGGGGFILKTDSKALDDMFKKQENERNEQIAADTTGEGYIYDMFRYELSNHEYCITQNISDALSALGISVKTVTTDQRMLKAMRKACNDINTWYSENG